MLRERNLWTSSNSTRLSFSGKNSPPSFTAVAMMVCSHELSFGSRNASRAMMRRSCGAISSPCNATIPLLTNGGSNTWAQCRVAMSRRWWQLLSRSARGLSHDTRSPRSKAGSLNQRISASTNIVGRFFAWVTIAASLRPYGLWPA